MNNEVVQSPELGKLAVQSDVGRQINPAIAYLISLGSKRSRRTMKSNLNVTARLFGYNDTTHCDWPSLMTRHHVMAVVEHLKGKGLAPSTVNTYMAALKGVALEAWMAKQIDTDTYQHIKQVKTVRGTRLPRGRALMRKEIGRLFSACGDVEEPKASRDAAILSVLLGCGLRRSEAVALDLESYDKTQSALIILGKGNKERIVFLPKETVLRLETWLSVRGEAPGALFYRMRRGGTIVLERMTDQAIYDILQKLRVRAGVDAFSPHDTRRSFATAMFSNKEDIITVKDAMGHASVTTTQRYDKRNDERLKEASERLRFEEEPSE